MNYRPVLALIALLAAPFVASTGNARPTAEPSCVAHWRFQNGVKDVAAVQNHLILDSSGNDQNGLAIGGPVFRRVNLPTGNLALEFTRDDQRVFVPDDAVFELPRSLTLEAWVRVDHYSMSISRLSLIVLRGDNRAGLDPWFLGVLDTGQLVFLVADELNRNAGVTSPAPLPLGRLVHVAGTLDDETGLMSLFVDGERVATTETAIRAAGVLGGEGPGIGIGNLQSGGPQAFRGLIAEVRVCAAALPPERFLRSAVTGR